MQLLRAHEDVRDGQPRMPAYRLSTHSEESQLILCAAHRGSQSVMYCRRMQFNPESRRFHAEKAPLTYPTHIDLKNWKKEIGIKLGDIKMLSFNHELGDEDEQISLLQKEHTHVLRWSRKPIDSINPRFSFRCQGPTLQNSEEAFDQMCIEHRATLSHRV